MTTKRRETAREQHGEQHDEQHDEQHEPSEASVDAHAIVNRAVTLDELTPHPRNYRRHPDAQLGRLRASLDRFSQVRSIVVQEGAPGQYLIVAGHGLVEAAKLKGLTTLRADVIPATWSPTQVEGYLVADNLLAESSDDDYVALAALLDEQQNAGYDLESLGSSADDLRALFDELADAADAPDDEEDIARPEAGAMPNPREFPLDVVFTISGPNATCCLAVQAGLKYGIQSAKMTDSTLCPAWSLDGKHRVTFLDNDYFQYDHATHLAAAQRVRPKYVTVRDAMTRAQCEEAGIDYYPLEQILAWADELSAHAEHVIVIPKYDCIDKIPERFMLGYSIPTSHGGTPLSVERFKGRRVHLLGGSWKAQLAYLAALGDDVVSLDNNYINLISRYAHFVTPTGHTYKLADVGLGHLTNPRYVALALSFGAIGAKLRELYGADFPTSDALNTSADDDATLRPEFTLDPDFVETLVHDTHDAHAHAHAHDDAPFTLDMRMHRDS